MMGQRVIILENCALPIELRRTSTVGVEPTATANKITNIIGPHQFILFYTPLCTHSLYLYFYLWDTLNSEIIPMVYRQFRDSLSRPFGFSLSLNRTANAISTGR